jgi:hypothetical protein
MYEVDETIAETVQTFLPQIVNAVVGKSDDKRLVPVAEFLRSLSVGRDVRDLVITGFGWSSPCSAANANSRTAQHGQSTERMMAASSSTTMTASRCTVPEGAMSLGKPTCPVGQVQHLHRPVRSFPAPTLRARPTQCSWRIPR